MYLLSVIAVAFLCFCAASSATDVAHSSCFMQMEENKRTFIMVPTPNEHNNAHTWHAVDSDTGDNLVDSFMYWDYGAWNLGRLAAGSGNRKAFLLPIEGKPSLNGRETCFEDGTRVFTWPGPSQSGSVYRLEAPYWTSCAPKFGSPRLRQGDRVIKLGDVSSHRDCVKAVANEPVMKFSAVLWNRNERKCEGIMHDGLPYDHSDWDTSVGSRMISCSFKCLPLRGKPLYHGAEADVVEYNGGKGSLKDCQAFVEFFEPHGHGAHYSSSGNCSHVSEVDGLALADPTEDYSGGSFCFSPGRVNHHRGCEFVEVDSASNPSCVGTFLYKPLDGPNKYRRYSTYQNWPGVAHETSWQFDHSMQHVLAVERDGDRRRVICRSGDTSEEVEVRCAADNKVCMSDRKPPVGYQRPVDYKEDIPGECPAYRVLPWAWGFEALAQKYNGRTASGRPAYISQPGSRHIEWDRTENVFRGCASSSDGAGRLRCRELTRSRSAVCDSTEYYCMYISVSEVDADSAECVGTYRLVSNKRWVQIKRDANQDQLHDQNVELRLADTENGDGFHVECTREDGSHIEDLFLRTEACSAEEVYCMDNSNYPNEHHGSCFFAAANGQKCRGVFMRYVADGVDDGAVFYRQVDPAWSEGTKWNVNYSDEFRLRRRDGAHYDCEEKDSSGRFLAVETDVEVECRGSDSVCLPGSGDGAEPCSYMTLTEEDTAAGECVGSYRKVSAEVWRKFELSSKDFQLRDTSVELYQISEQSDELVVLCSVRDALVEIRVNSSKRCSGDKDYCMGAKDFSFIETTEEPALPAHTETGLPHTGVYTQRTTTEQRLPPHTESGLPHTGVYTQRTTTEQRLPPHTETGLPHTGVYTQRTTTEQRLPPHTETGLPPHTGVYTQLPTTGVYTQRTTTEQRLPPHTETGLPHTGVYTQRTTTEQRLPVHTETGLPPHTEVYTQRTTTEQRLPMHTETGFLPHTSRRLRS